MGRRKDHSRQELAELVLSTAAQIVAEEGGRLLTTRKIAAIIGYSPGSIYNVFANLDAVVAHVNTQTLHGLNQTIAGLKLTGNPQADALCIVATYLDYAAANPALWAAVVQQTMRTDQGLPDYLAAEMAATFKRVETALAPLFEAHQEGQLQISVRVLWAALQGISSLPPTALVLADQGVSKETLSKHIVETYLRGIQNS